jgi:uncharacterized protein YodC (DUF2158 family)
MAQTTALLIAPPAWGKTQILNQLIENGPRQPRTTTPAVEDSITVGSVVHLKSGGLRMTVLAVQAQEIEVIWSSYSGLDERIIPRSAVKLCTAPDQNPTDEEIPF